MAKGGPTTRSLLFFYLVFCTTLPSLDAFSFSRILSSSTTTRRQQLYLEQQQSWSLFQPKEEKEKAWRVPRGFTHSFVRMRDTTTSTKPYALLQQQRPYSSVHRRKLSSIRRLSMILLTITLSFLPKPRCAHAAAATSFLSQRLGSRRQVIVRFVLAGLATLLAREWIQVIQRRRQQAEDATACWSFYAEHPAARGRALGALAFKIAPAYLLAKVCGRWFPQQQKRLYQRSGNQLADGLLQIGPLYIKLGQIVSCQSEDVLPAEWITALAKLQDQVPAMEGDKALALAHDAWPGGQTAFDATFSHFTTTPLAAASLGQVHKAVLRDSNTTVALKVQRRGLRQIYNQDFKLLTAIAATVDRFSQRRNSNKKKKKNDSLQQQSQQQQSVSWTGIFESAEEILYREIDYRDEANHGMRFCQDFGVTVGGRPATPQAKARDGTVLPSAAPWLRAPFVYGNYSSEQVLTMEFVPSIKVTRAVEQRDQYNLTTADLEYLADCLGRAYLRQFCSHRFFSTDPHPGNLGVEILNPDAVDPARRVRLVFYDFGQAATLTQGQSDGILEILQAIVDMDVDASMKSFQTMGVLTDDADLDAVRAKVADNYRTGKVKANRKRLKQRGYKFQNATETNSTTNVTAEKQHQAVKDSTIMQYFTLPAEYAFVGRALSQLSGVGKVLDAEFDFVSASAPWIYEVTGAGQYLQGEVQKWVESNLPGLARFFFPHDDKEEEQQKVQ